MDFQPVRQVRASERMVEQIERAVLSGALTPGQRLSSERELMKQFEVSRPTVREALRVLESDGIIRSRPGDPRGPEVLSFTPEALRKPMSRLAALDGLSLSELLQFRMMLEGMSAFLAAALRTESQLAEMTAAMAVMREASALGYREFSKADVAFHDAMARASGNRLIQVCADVVRGVVLDLMADKITHATDQSTLMSGWIQRHSAVLDAIADRDAVRAGRLMRLDLFEYYASSVPPQDQQILQRLVEGPDLPG